MAQQISSANALIQKSPQHISEQEPKQIRSQGRNDSDEGVINQIQSKNEQQIINAESIADIVKSQLPQNLGQQLASANSQLMSVPERERAVKKIQQSQNQCNQHRQNIGKNEDKVQNQQKPVQLDEPIPFNFFLCHLCQQPLIATIQISCGHAFCQFCLSEYMLVARSCPFPGCFSPKTREKRGSTNKRLDELVQQFVSYLGTEAISNFNQRKQQRRIYKQNRRIPPQQMKAGTKIDIRDDDFIWRKGRIIRTFNRISNDQVRVKFVVVEYLNGYCNSQKRQQFTTSCSRIARQGFYTSRAQNGQIPNTIKRVCDDAEYDKLCSHLARKTGNLQQNQKIQESEKENQKKLNQDNLIEGQDDQEEQKQH